jgi:hypothetical protein
MRRSAARRLLPRINHGRLALHGRLDARLVDRRPVLIQHHIKPCSHGIVDSRDACVPEPVDIAQAAPLTCQRRGPGARTMLLCAG